MPTRALQSKGSRHSVATAQPTCPHPLIRLVLFEPDIPQNAGAIMRLAACMGVPLDLIEPCGFPLDDQRLRRAEEWTISTHSTSFAINRGARSAAKLADGWSC